MKEEISILVVDDESLMRNLVYKILDQGNYKVQLAASVDEALEALSQKEFQLVIADIKMPERNGLELLKRVKEDHPQVGVVMMTAYGDTYSAREVLHAGAEEYIAKPFKSKQLTSAVERAYQRVLSNLQRGDDGPVEAETDPAM